VLRASLFGEIVAMSWETLRVNKLRSALTVLGIVIGVTSIVGITALVRGLDQTFRELISEIGPDTIYVQKMSFTSVGTGITFEEMMRRPNLTPADADAIGRLPSIQVVDVMFGAGGPGGTQSRLYYRNQRTKPLAVLGTTERWPFVMGLVVESGRFFTPSEVQRRQNLVVLGQSAVSALFPTGDPLGKKVRLNLYEFTVVGVMAKRPNPGLGGDDGPDDFVIIPQTTYQKLYGIRANLATRGEMRSIQIAALPREGVDRASAMREIEAVMRIRHRLQLQDPNDFELVTQDVVLAFWDRITQATFLALVVLSSIALVVGGIGVMSIMTISVTDRTREIGVRKALGARRVEILWQFLIEAVFLTLSGGLLGIAFGAAIGLGVHWLTGFPVSLPWWSFAIGIGFSAAVGIFFGMFPAVRASRLDPIEALRNE
jgi:putative ABC transport system permease protein